MAACWRERTLSVYTSTYAYVQAVTAASSRHRLTFVSSTVSSDSLSSSSVLVGTALIITTSAYGSLSTCYQAKLSRSNRLIISAQSP